MKSELQESSILSANYFLIRYVFQRICTGFGIKAKSNRYNEEMRNFYALFGLEDRRPTYTKIISDPRPSYKKEKLYQKFQEYSGIEVDIFKGKKIFTLPDLTADELQLTPEKQPELLKKLDSAVVMIRNMIQNDIKQASDKYPDSTKLIICFLKHFKKEGNVAQVLINDCIQCLKGISNLHLRKVLSTDSSNPLIEEYESLLYEQLKSIRIIRSYNGLF